MKRGKISANERAQSRLLDYWQRKPEYGQPIGCVTTTFTFDAAFFEEHCLSRFLGMDTDPSEDARTYLIEREEKLSEAFSAVLVDQLHVPLQRSLRWHVFAARVANGGILHAKLTLLAWEHRIRVIVSSANLTPFGYRKNLENAGALDFTPDGEVPVTLLLDALAFFDVARATAPGADDVEGPQKALKAFLEARRAQIVGWKDAAWGRGAPTASLVIVGPGRPHLFEQLRTRWTYAPATSAWVVSPFFDEGDRAKHTAATLESILIQRGDQEVTFIVAGQKLPDETITLEIPKCLATSSRARTEYRHELVVPRDGEDPRPLHAKSLWLQRDDSALYCIGSSNFTQAGTGARGTPGPINLEANLVYVLPSRTDEFGRVCSNAYPHFEPVDASAPNVLFLEPGSRTPEPEGFALLPLAFTTATLRKTDTGHCLELELDGEPPEGFIVHLPDGAVLLNADTWASQGRPSIVKCPLDLSGPPPSYLEIAWTTSEGVRRAIWTVNVADTTTIPPPEELRTLSLEDLLAVLTSARPAHETIGRILASRAVAKAASEYETDPHKKVDTRHHLLKRMRRAAAAMEELRSRLERASFSRDALKARLFGPLGPLSLASKLVAEEPAGASFMIAELATTVASAKLDPRGDLSMEDAQQMLRTVVVELRQLASQHPAPPNLAAYVAATFQEVCP